MRELQRLTSSLRNSYGKRGYGEKDEEILDFLYTKLAHIPGEALEWIEQRFLSNYERFPDRFHAAVLSCWYDWRREHPEKYAADETECRQEACHGGLLLLYDTNTNGKPWRECAARCGECRKLANNNGPGMVTVAEAVKRGFVPRTAKSEKEYRTRCEDGRFNMPDQYVKPARLPKLKDDGWREKVSEMLEKHKYGLGDEPF